MDEKVGINKGEREFEIGKDESWFVNNKRTYDAYQDLDLQLARQQLAHLARVQVIAEQALQNLVRGCNNDNNVATDCIWVPGPGEENIPPVDNTKA